MRRLAIVVCALAPLCASAALAQTHIQPPITPLPPPGAGAGPGAPLQIQPPTLSADLRIVWEVKNRFRLFRREADFQKHVAAQSIKSVLAAEQIMAQETDGRGWARNMLANLCIDLMGAITTTCDRDGQRESYLAPADHRVEMRLVGAAPQSACAWVFDEGDGQPRTYNGSCSEEVRIRLAYGKASAITVDVSPPGAPQQRATTQVEVRDLLIAGLGDSIAAGEGNPDRPVALSDEGFCFRRFGTGSEYFRPGRATFKGDRTCEAGNNSPQNLAEWSRLGARWMSQACHRSLYSYQLRTALALAVENPHVAVTFIPLACTGATIENGVLGSQRARELNCTTDRACPTNVTAQVTQLQQYLATARRTRPGRNLDLVLLTVGANDIDFSGLVANVIIDSSRERVLFGSSVISSVEFGRERADAHAARELCQAAHRVEADGRRRTFARGVRLLRPPGAARGRLRVRQRAGGLRRASLVPARRRPDAPRRGFRRCALPAAAQGDRAMRELPKPGGSHDLRRRTSAGVRRPRRLRAVGAGPGIRPRVLQG